MNVHRRIKSIASAPVVTWPRFGFPAVLRVDTAFALEALEAPSKSAGAPSLAIERAEDKRTWSLAVESESESPSEPEPVSKRAVRVPRAPRFHWFHRFKGFGGRAWSGRSVRRRALMT